MGIYLTIVAHVRPSEGGSLYNNSYTLTTNSLFGSKNRAYFVFK